MDLPKKYTISQAGEILGVSSKTLRRWEKAGKISAKRTPSGNRFYTQEDLETLKNINSSRTYSVGEAARELGISAKTIRRWDKAGKIEIRRDSLGNRIFEQKDIDLLKNNFDSDRLITKRSGQNPFKDFSFAFLFAILIGSATIFALSSYGPYSQAIKNKVSDLVFSFSKNSIDQYIQDKIKSYQNVLGEKQSVANLGSQISQLPILSPTNHIINSSFEGGITGYSLIAQSTQDNTKVTNESVRTGTQSLRFSDPACSVTPTPCMFGISQSQTTTINGRDYTISLYIRKHGLTGEPKLRVGLFGEVSKNDPLYLSKAPNFSSYSEDKYQDFFLSSLPSEEWVRVEADFKNLPLGKYPIIELYDYRAGSLYVEDLQLLEGTDEVNLGGGGNGQSGQESTGILWPSEQSNTKIGDNTIVADSLGNIYPQLPFTGGSIGTSSNSFQELHLSKLAVDKDGNLATSGSISGSSLTVSSVSGNLYLPDGSAGSPSLSFTNETNSGFYRITTNTLGFSTAGVERLRIDSSNTTIAGGAIVSGATTLSSTLGVTGTTSLNGAVNIGSGSGNDIAVNGRITTSILPKLTANVDLGSSSLKFNNLYTQTINTSGTNTSGQATFNQDPPTTAIVDSSVFINPTTAANTGAALLGLGIAGVEKARIDNQGNIILGYSSASASVASDPFNVYNHGTTRVANITTAGALSLSAGLTATTGNFSSTLTAGNGLSLTTGALNLTSTSGAVGLTLGSSTTAFNVNSGIFDIDTTNSRVGIGTTVPGALLELSNGTNANIFLTKTGINAGTAQIYNDGALNILSNNNINGIYLRSDTTFFYNRALSTAYGAFTSTGLGVGTISPVAGSGLTIAPAARTSGTPSLLTITAPADTTLTAAEAIDVNLNLARTEQFTGSATPGAANITTQRATLIQAPTYAFSSTGAQTITNAATLAISGAPTAGTNATITNPYALWVQGGNSLFAGNLTTSGTFTSSGFTNIGTFTTSGGTANINITGTSNTAIGNSTGTFAVTSTGFNVTTGGLVSGVSRINLTNANPTGASLTGDTLTLQGFGRVLIDTATAQADRSIGIGNTNSSGIFLGSTIAPTTAQGGLTVDTNQNLTLSSGTGTYTQTFTGTTTNAFAITANSLTSGNAINVSSSSTAATTGDALVNLSVSGANASSAITRYGLYSAVTSTGTTSTNVGVYATATGATNNYAAIFDQGNVGIGTTSPDQKLEIAGNLHVDGGSRVQSDTYNNAANTANIIYRSGTNTIVGNNASALVVQDAGNVGIGTTGPGNLLTVSQLGTDQISALRADTTVGGVRGMVFSGLNSSSAVVNYGGIYGGITSATAGSHTGFVAIYTPFAGTMGERVRIDSAGNVGIGTTGPTGTLHIDTGNATAFTANTNRDDLIVQANGVAGLTIVSNINTEAGFQLTTTGLGNLNGFVAYLSNPTGNSNTTFRVQGTDIMTLQTGGNVGIGTTSPSNTLQVVGSICAKSTNVACAANVAGTIYATNTTVQAADVAENYISRENLEPGTLISPASDGNNQAVIPTSSSYQSSMIGIISTNPGVTLNSDAKTDNSHPYLLPVALSGRVPVKLTTENGVVKAGDYLTSSATKPGYAMKATKAGRVVGVALQDLDSTNCDPSTQISSSNFGLVTGGSCSTGKILVFVNPSYFDPDSNLATTDNLSIVGSNQSFAVVNSQSGEQIKRVGVFSDAVIGNLKVGSIDSQSLTLLGTKLQDLIGLKSATSSAQTSQPTTDPSILSRLNDFASRLSLLEKTASISATLTSTTLSASQSASFDNLTVGKKLTTNDLGITGNVSAGLLSIIGLEPTLNASTVNTLSGDLYIQNLGLGGINFLNGKVNIDKTGDVTVQNKITAQQVEADKFSSGKAAGSAVLRANTASIDVTAPNANPTARVLLTPTSATDRVLSVTNKGDGKFTVSVKSQDSQDINFDWFIIN